MNACVGKRNWDMVLLASGHPMGISHQTLHRNTENTLLQYEKLMFAISKPCTETYKTYPDAKGKILLQHHINVSCNIKTRLLRHQSYAGET